MKSIYVFEGNGQFKVGVSKNVDARLRSIRTGNPGVRVMYESEKVSNAYKIESMIHSYLSAYRTSGEWFSVAAQVNVVEVVKGFVEEYGVQEEYHETEENKLTRLMERLLAPTKRATEFLNEETKRIDMENEKLKEELQSIGWSDADIQKIVDEAENRVLSQYT